MPAAMSETILQAVFVILAMREIHLEFVHEEPQHLFQSQKLLIPAIHHHVVKMLTVRHANVQQHVSVYQNILEIHM